MNGQLELGEVTPARYFTGIAVAVGLMFGFVTEPDDGNRHTLLHFAQWQLQALLPMALLVLSHLLLARFTPLERLSRWLQLVVSGVVGALLFAPFAAAVDVALLGEPLRGSWPMAVLDEFAAVAPPVVVCWVGINAPWVLGLKFSRSPRGATVECVEDEVDASVAMPGFLAQVPLRDLAELIYLEAELHYLAVVTTSGRTLLLYSLRDAVDELGSLRGMQTHRAFWVAGRHVTGFRRVGRQAELRLSNGDAVPVSRRKLASVREWCESMSFEAQAPPQGSRDRSGAS
jgi:hypothetical protein